MRNKIGFCFFFLFTLNSSFCVLRSSAETRITGGRMDVLNQGDKVVFSDGVHLTRDSDQMWATTMTTNKNRDKVTAVGNVRFIRVVSATETWKASGQRGFYETQTGNGTLEGNARVTRYEALSATATRTTRITARKIDFFSDPQRAIATGKVEGRTDDPSTGSRYEFKATTADYQANPRTITLTDAPRPTLYYWENGARRTITGDVVLYDLDRQRLISTGNAQAVVVDPRAHREKKGKQP